MAGWLMLLYLLLIAGLFGVAIYEHQTATSLFLPVSSTLTVLTILLPILSLFNTIYYHKSTSPSSSSQSSPLGLPAPNATSSLITPQKSTTSTKKITIPGTLQFAQTILTTYLFFTYLSITTTSASGLESPATDCLLSGKWKSLWTSHNGEAIKHIQDALSCCGFRTVKDMAYPFPTGSPDDGKKHVDCVARYGRHTPCLAGWEGELRSLVGGEVAILVLTGILQFAGWYFAGKVSKNGGGNTAGGIGEVLKGLWMGISRMGGRRDRGRDWDDEDESNTGSRHGRGTNGGRGGRGSGRSSRLLVGGGEVGRLVEVDNDDESTGERDMGRDVERGHEGYGTAGSGAPGDVWRSG